MHPPAIPSTVITRPLIHFGRELCGDLACGLRREWLVTSGVGGYASGTVAGVNTRSYHGLLVAALTPPVDRTVLVGGLGEWATYDGHRSPLSTQEFADGTLDPHGYRQLQAFALEGTIPAWTFALADALLEPRIWMEHGTSTPGPSNSRACVLPWRTTVASAGRSWQRSPVNAPLAGKKPAVSPGSRVPPFQ